MPPSRSTPAPASPKSSASTSTTCADPGARAYCVSTANGDKIREVPLHAKLHEDLDLWLAERPDWPGADTNPALFLNRRSASAIIADIGRTAGLDEQTTAHILRHSFATTSFRGGTDLVIVAELLGHARLETVRAYTKPTEEDKAKALNLLPVDR